MSDREGVVPIDPDRRARTRPPRPEPHPAAGGPSRDALLFPDPDDALVARRSFVRRTEMRDLRAGRIRPERTLDLHGHDRREAERAVREAVIEAAGERMRCLLVVAGRGRRSAEGAPVLREHLPGWLASPTLAGHVAAFAPAVAADGGRGALYVLLR